MQSSETCGHADALAVIAARGRDYTVSPAAHAEPVHVTSAPRSLKAPTACGFVLDPYFSLAGLGWLASWQSGWLSRGQV